MHHVAQSFVWLLFSIFKDGDSLMGLPLEFYSSIILSLPFPLSVLLFFPYPFFFSYSVSEDKTQSIQMNMLKEYKSSLCNPFHCRIAYNTANNMLQCSIRLSLPFLTDAQKQYTHQLHQTCTLMENLNSNLPHFYIITFASNTLCNFHLGSYAALMQLRTPTHKQVTAG